MTAVRRVVKTILAGGETSIAAGAGRYGVREIAWTSSVSPAV
jgi:hypothetical protein